MNTLRKRKGVSEICCRLFRARNTGSGGNVKKVLLRIPILLAILALTGCSSTGQLSTRHQETGVNTRFRSDGMTFKEYIDYTQRIILKYRVDIEPGTRERILAANSPFEFRPDAGACGLAEGEKPAREIGRAHV